MKDDGIQLIADLICIKNRITLLLKKARSGKDVDWYTNMKSISDNITVIRKRSGGKEVECQL